MGFTDLSSDSYAVDYIASYIENSSYDILVFEFHEPIDVETIIDCEVGHEKFVEWSSPYYETFIKPTNVDWVPANISVAAKIKNEWFVTKNGGSNYYLGNGPRQIINLRKVCLRKNIKILVLQLEIEEWLNQRFIGEIKIKNIKDINKKQSEDYNEKFDELTDFISRLTKELQIDNDFVNEEEGTVRDRFKQSFNAKYSGRATAETKRRNQYLDLQIKTEDSRNEFIIEFKKWDKVKDIQSDFNQLYRYLEEFNQFGIFVYISRNKYFKKVVDKVRNRLLSEQNLEIDFPDKINRQYNELRFSTTNNEKIIHYIFLNLHIDNQMKNKKSIEN